MITYQELLKAIDAGQLRDFLVGAINKHQSSEEYRMATMGRDYMRQLNTTITQYRKWLYDMNGTAVPDNYSANYKCASSYYKQNVIQLSQYLLANGATFENETTKDKLGGSRFDNTLVRAVRTALAEGVSFAFYNNGDVVMFKLTEFIPLWDEETGALRAGIRYWQLANSKPLRITLYMEDGYTDFIRPTGGNLQPMDGFDEDKRRAYIQVVSAAPADDTAIIEGVNYPAFPIVPCYGNYEKQAELVGKQAHIDCYDLIESGYANDIDEATYIYWILNNAGGMDDIDINEFRQRLRTLHVVKTDDETSVTAQNMTVPSEARETLLTRLERDIYNDAMALDTQQITAGNITATAIRAAYQRLDNRADELEYCVIEFVQGLLKLIGVEDTPRFQRSRMTNQEEETNMIIAAVSAGLVDTETGMEHLPWVTPEERQGILDRLATSDMSKYDTAEAEE